MPAMDARQRAAYQALSQLDPELAGLFARGCELTERIHEPGACYLIGHVGRELSKAVLHIVSREVPPVPDTRTSPTEAADAAAIDRRRQSLAELLQLGADDSRLDTIFDMLGDDHRDIVARALSLSSNHPLVQSWVKLQRAFVAATHYRKGRTPPSTARVADAFQQLVSLLFGRIAPYFDAQGELDELIRITIPRSEDIDRVRALLVRPQLRFRFFRELRHPDWLQPLQNAGVFDYAPEWLPAPGGGHRLVAWPEGELLVRMAEHVPQLVAKTLAKTPRDLQNPAVWRLVAEAICHMPNAQGRRLVPLLSRFTRHSQASYCVPSMINAAIVLATAADRSAFKLCEALFRFQPLPDDNGSEDTKWFRFRPDQLLVCLDRYEVGEVIQKVIPVLTALDGIATWSLLIGRLKVARRFADRAGFDDDGFSAHWCPSLDSASDDDDIRAQLAVAAVTVGRAILRRDPSMIGALLETLDSKGAGFFNRIKILLVIEAGSHAQAHLDGILSDPATLDPPYGAREIALLLRGNFESGSLAARGTFVAALAAGPPLEDLRVLAGISDDDLDDHPALQEALEAWQRRRLRWFHDRIPEELRALANRLGLEPAIPSPRHQALDEVGFYSYGVSSHAPISPISVDKLSELPTADILALLQTWHPTGSRFDGPSEQGLEIAIENLLGTDLSKWADLIQAIARDDGLRVGYRQAALRALHKTEQAQTIPWTAAIELVATTLRITDGTKTSPESDWRWARQEALTLIKTTCANNQFPTELKAVVFDLVELAIKTSPQWVNDPSSFNNFGNVVSARFSTDAGAAAETTIAVMLWAYRGRTTDELDQFRPRLESWLDQIRGWTDSHRVAGRARLGEYLPHVVHWHGAWISHHEEDLFSTGLSDPLGNTTWGAYLTLGTFYDETFRLLRKWFGRHASEISNLIASEDVDPAHDKEWRISRHYLWHGMVAYLRGLISFDEPDRALEVIFDASRAEDRAHVYWQICRGWNEATDLPPPEYIDRVLRLWEWRLDRLEAERLGDTRAEEADGLCWLIRTRPLPPDRLLAPAMRTVALAAPNRSTRRMLWPRVTELAALDVTAGIEMAAKLIDLEASSEWPYFDVAEVSGVLRIGMESSESAVRDRAIQLVHRLGDKGWSEFGQLLEGQAGQRKNGD